MRGVQLLFLLKYHDSANRLLKINNRDRWGMSGAN
jgi:hypothetical protein